MSQIVAGQMVMSQIVGEPAAKPAKPAKRRLYPLEGTVSGILTGVTADAEPKPWATFTFNYGVKHGGRVVRQEREAKALGKSLLNVQHLLVEGGDARLLCLFNTRAEGETIVAVGVPGRSGQDA